MGNHRLEGAEGRTVETDANIEPTCTPTGDTFRVETGPGLVRGGNANGGNSVLNWAHRPRPGAVLSRGKGKKPPPFAPP